MDGLLDWYLVGVAAGLGVSAAAASPLARGSGGLRAVALGAAVVAAVAAVVLAVVAVVWAAVAFGGALALAFPSLRRLSPAAAPAALALAAVVAVVPAAGYLAALAAPIAGKRLARRAQSRHAGLRVLARD